MDFIYYLINSNSDVAFVRVRTIKLDLHMHFGQERPTNYCDGLLLWLLQDIYLQKNTVKMSRGVLKEDGVFI